MSVVSWIIIGVIVIPILGLLVWMVLSASFVRIAPGTLGLLLIRGRPSDITLPPGPHFVFAFRRRMVETYPSVELTYRAGGPDDATVGDLEKAGPALRVTLGDRTTASVPYTVRFRLRPEELRGVHERFGPDGIFGVVRDESSRAVTTSLGDPGVTVEDMFGLARDACQEAVGAAVATKLSDIGIEMTGFVLGAVDLGRTGEVIQATIRARHELDQEKAEAITRLVRAANDADLRLRVTSSEEPWRYREGDLLRDLVQRTEALQVALYGSGLGGTASASPAAGPEAGESAR